MTNRLQGRSILKNGGKWRKEYRKWRVQTLLPEILKAKSTPVVCLIGAIYIETFPIIWRQQINFQHI